MAILYRGDVGTRILVETNYDLTNAISVKLAVKKPDGSVVVWNGDGVVLSSLTNTNSIIEYYTRPGDLDQIGDYVIQAVVELPPGKPGMPNWVGRGESAILTVLDHFQ